MQNIESISDLLSVKNRLVLEGANLEQSIASQWQSIKEQATPMQVLKQLLMSALEQSPSKKGNGALLLNTMVMNSAEIIFKSIGKFCSRRAGCRL